MPAWSSRGPKFRALGGVARSWWGARAARRAGVAAAVLLGGVVVATGQAAPASQVDLSGMTAWLASTRYGTVTLLDGSSEQVMAASTRP
jgi:hypothetical protein